MICTPQKDGKTEFTRPSQSLALDVVFSTMFEIKNQLSVVRSKSIGDIVCDIYICNNDIKLITLIC